MGFSFKHNVVLVFYHKEEYDVNYIIQFGEIDNKAPKKDRGFD
jgi:hypothetical protein